LSTHAWVAGDGCQESGEDHTDTDTGTTETDGSGTHTQVLGDLDHSSGDLRVERAGGLAAHGVTGGGSEDLRSLLTLHCLERSAGADAREGTLGDNIGLDAAADDRASDLGRG